MNLTTTLRVNRVLAALLLSAGLMLTAPVQAQVKPKLQSSGVANPESMIYIGNSFFYFNNGISSHVSGLLAAADAAYKFRSSLVTISGSGFDWHDVESYFRPNAVGRYSFLPGNIVGFNAPKKLFDLALMMDCSQCPLHPQLKGIFTEYAKKHAETVRKHGAQPVLFMSWAYLDKPEMTQQLADAYTQAGNDNDALVVPAGLAFARVVAQRPGLSLYIADQRHPTLAGTYLAAATTYAAVFKKSPVGLGFHGGLDPAVAAYLQAAAWETAQSYYQP